MKNLLLASTALAFLATAGPAAAGPVDWNFLDHQGALGTTQTFTSNGIGLVLTARGFNGADVGTDLFGKNAGVGETGLGLTDDPSNNNDEISGKNFIQLNLDGIRGSLSGFQFSMNSVDHQEGWAVYGSNDATILNPLAPFQFTLLASSSGFGDNGLHSLAGGYDNYNFFYSGGAPGAGGCGSGCDANVLIGSFDATAVPGPIVGAGLPGLVAGCMTMLGLGRWRRKRNLAV